MSMSNEDLAKLAKLHAELAGMRDELASLLHAAKEHKLKRKADKKEGQPSSKRQKVKKVKAKVYPGIYSVAHKDGTCDIYENGLNAEVLRKGDNVSHHKTLDEAKARDPKQLWLYTDGSYKSSEMRSGYSVYVGYQDTHNVSEVVASGSAQRMEVLAMKRALTMWSELPVQARDGRRLHICTDSGYVFNTLWNGGGTGVGWAYAWRRNQDVDKKYFDDFMVCLDLLDRFGGSITAAHVRAHKGVFGNEMADRLAKGEPLPIFQADDVEAGAPSSDT